jgi:hypothetical protein
VPVVDQASNGVLVDVVAPDLGIPVGIGRPVREQMITEPLHAHRIQRHEPPTEIGGPAAVGPPDDPAGRLFDGLLHDAVSPAGN